MTTSVGNFDRRRLPTGKNVSELSIAWDLRSAGERPPHLALRRSAKVLRHSDRVLINAPGGRRIAAGQLQDIGGLRPDASAEESGEAAESVVALPQRLEALRRLIASGGAQAADDSGLVTRLEPVEACERPHKGDDAVDRAAHGT